jgi:hypothetical protein
MIRCGAFATPDADRVKAGAGYYGVMELSGNVYEITITVGNPQGRIFDGRHGDGILNSNGNANVTNWPDNATAVGAGLRGGFWLSLNQQEAKTSDRSSAAFMQSYYQVGYGCRGGRTTSN